MKITTFSFPDTFSNDGNINLKNGVNALNQNLGLMVKCQRPQLRGDPTFGTDIINQKFQQNTAILRSCIKDDIIILTERYDTRVLMGNGDVDVSFQGDYFHGKCRYYLKSEDSQFGYNIKV
jgi:hypothetical protein